MSRPVLYLAITSHGFGHAVRVASVAGHIQRLNPDILLVFVTTVPRWLLESYVPGDFIHRPRTLDVGVIQSDSLQMDKAATLAKLQQIYTQQRSIITGEVNFIRTNRVQLILADIPPLAVPIAHEAGIPCWMMSNFGWDFIYRAWGDDFNSIVDWIQDCYQRCDLLFRLPLSESMGSFPTVTEVGLTGGDPRYEEEELRQKFGLSKIPDKTVLLTFGGLGLQEIPYYHLRDFPDWDFITFDRQAPKLANLKIIQDYHYRPVDFMPLVGRVISKPGYSTFAEALRLRVPLISLTRDDFAEAPVLIQGLQNYGKHNIVTTQDFFHNPWYFLSNSPQLPLEKAELAIDGSRIIAQKIVQYFSDS